ncbi:MAG: hypothetical protein RLY40_26 [Pseudomonadota bacterium]|jgi:hypothetical protein
MMNDKEKTEIDLANQLNIINELVLESITNLRELQKFRVKLMILRISEWVCLGTIALYTIKLIIIAFGLA